MSPMQFSVLMKILFVIAHGIIYPSSLNNGNRLFDAEETYRQWHDWINDPKHDERRML